MKALAVAVAISALLLSMAASVATLRALGETGVDGAEAQPTREILDALDGLRNAVTALNARVDDAVASMSRQGGQQREAAGVPAGARAGTSPDTTVSFAYPNGPVVGAEDASAGYDGLRPPGTVSEPAPPRLLVVDPTPEQQEIYDRFDKRLDDPAYLQTLNIEDLLGSAEFKAMPEPLQKLVLNKAADKFNRGEIDRETFLRGFRAGD